MKKNTISGFVLILLLVRPGCGLKDPPTLYCEENGGTIKTRYVEDGEPMRICVFEDSTACDEECFYKGGCHKGVVQEYTTFCKENGGQLITRRIEWGTVGNVPWIDPDVLWCIYGDDTACSQFALEDRYCHKIDVEWRDILHDNIIPFEMFCEVTGGEVVKRGFPWGTEDGQPPIDHDDVCIFDDEDNTIIAKLHPEQVKSIFPFLDAYHHSEKSIPEYAYYTCFEETEETRPVKSDFTHKEILDSINAYLSEYCNDIGATSQIRNDEVGDEYVLCINGDKVCGDALDLYYNHEECDDGQCCEKGTEKPLFPVFCERSGGKMTDDQVMCTYHHKASEWVSEQYMSCIERDYYRWGCDVLGTSFPFEEPPTHSTPCDDGFEVEIHQDEHNSQYAICVGDSDSECPLGWRDPAEVSMAACLRWGWDYWAGHWVCNQCGPMFAAYCTEGKSVWNPRTNENESLKGKLSYQTFDFGQLPVCTFPKIEQDGSYFWLGNANDAGMVCTERFYYDNGGCLPFDVHGFVGPSGAAVPFRQSIFLAALSTTLLFLS